MEKKPKRCKNLISDKDMISSLPDNVIEMILSRLLLKDAIRTSFLSRDWRYKWRTMPDLIFQSDSFQSSCMLGKVNRVLLLHKGDIRKFEFSQGVTITQVMDTWLDHLVGANVQELVIASKREYFIPFTVFCFDKLITLNLKRCKIKLPSSFDGLKSLTSLILESITFITDTALVSLIKLCPLLKHLTIKDCRQRLELHEPNHQSLPIDNSIVCSPFVGIYNRSSIQEIKFNWLKEVQLSVNLDCSQESAVVCCIIKNSPTLSCLNIISKKFQNRITFWEEPDNISFNFDHLKIFDMDNVVGSKSEMRFIKFILGNARLLEVSNIQLDWNAPLLVKEVDILREMLSFRRASRAKVNCQGIE